MAKIPLTVAQDAERAGAGLQLVVLEGDSVVAYDLPEQGSLFVGRGDDLDVQLTNPNASARHARLDVEAGRVRIVDLGSRNGTEVRGQKIEPQKEHELGPGDVVALGTAALLLQPRRGVNRPRRVWRHGYFEARVTEECELAPPGAASFSVARIDLAPAASTETFVEIAGKLLRPFDVVGLYGPRAFEVLVRRASPEAAQRLVELLRGQLSREGVEARTALAHFPADGRSADALIEKACARLRPASNGAPAGREVIVLDEAMRQVYALAEKAARGAINVLILGETGVGKEVLAETVHRASKRADRPFLCLNCATLSENLLESELFGHERGAFTDAKTAKPGLLETASGGTVFLDEIGEMSPAVQAKVLRVIETKQLLRVGGVQPVTVDVRFVSATHRDLVQEVREKRFRVDLYYRLNGLRLEIPPLRERRAEIRPLCEAFLKQLAREAGASHEPRLSDAAVTLLEAYAWPGNIRELRNMMERALLLADGGDIEPEHLPTETLVDPVSDAVAGERAIDLALAEQEGPPDKDDRWNREERAERARILEALRAEGGNQTRAAKRLGISRGTLLARLERFEIGRPQKRPS
jgi:DNA-binding NtrC family response regulator